MRQISAGRRSGLGEGAALAIASGRDVEDVFFLHAKVVEESVA
jgi:hypothetical protein